jgi:hypothetical protein
MKGNERLTAKQLKAIEALLTTRTRTEAAAAAQLGETTLWRYLQNPSFQSAYKTARREGIKQSVARLQQLTRKAVNVLEDLLEDDTLPAMVKIRLVDISLSHAFKANEFEELEEIQRQLTKLEDDSDDAS